MSQITVQCRLVATEATRRCLWELMAIQNTPLISELLQQIPLQDNFQTWRSQGRLPRGTVEKLCQPLKSDPRFIGQPSRFYTSAIDLVSYIYKSWFKSQQRVTRKLEGLTRWLAILRSDEELIEQSRTTLEAIRDRASQILATRAEQSPDSSTSFFELFQSYTKSKNLLTRTAIAYLLKNSCKLPVKAENAEKFAKRRRQTEIKIERLQQQVNSRLPHERDLTDDKWLETLFTATTKVPEDHREARAWQDALLTKTASVPFPVSFETNEDLSWHENDKGRLCVKFNGLSEHSFEVYCDRRQLKWFQRFLEDQQIKRQGKGVHSSALFGLRSATIVWQERAGKGDPWNLNRVALHCSVDTRLWTAEGTEQVRQEKAAEVAAIITRMKDKGDLTDNQQAFLKRKNSTLSRLNHPFPRPSQPLYRGQSHIVVGVALGLEKPATAAVVDAIAGQAIAYRSVKQLLGTNYRLVYLQASRCAF